MSQKFEKISRWFAGILGSPIAFILAFAFVVMWALVGPIFGFSEGWQLTINTVTTIFTFLMVFLLQTSANRDTQSMQLKLDELIRSIDQCEEGLLNLDDLSMREIDELRKKYRDIGRKARQAMEKIEDHIEEIIEDSEEAKVKETFEELEDVLEEAESLKHEIEKDRLKDLLERVDDLKEDFEEIKEDKKDKKPRPHAE